jgi:hypothetical protein
MRTTIELPDELFRRVKARAATEGVKLKDLITEYVEQGLKRDPDRIAAERKRAPLPVIKSAATGDPIPALSREELARFEEEEDLAKLARSFGR